MSQISITLPLDMFGDRSVDEVIQNIKEAEYLRAENNEQAGRILDLKQRLTDVATDLTNIVNADEDVMWKFQGLRALSTGINGMIRDMR